MSVYHDWIDWLGGYPFEVARPEDVIKTFREAGFELTNLTTTNRLGCNQYVFTSRTADSDAVRVSAST
jgi:2-polyprenyl-6-hydroxyphenyl methylase/3-demethylubiquinone-9 3-methyltransferase